MTTINPAIITNAMNVYGLSRKTFENKAFIVDGVQSDALISFALLQLERKALKPYSENNINDVVYTCFKTELENSVKFLEGYSANVGEYEKRRIACVMPFINGIKCRIELTENNGFSKEDKKQLDILTAKLLQYAGEYIKLQDAVSTCKTKADYDDNNNKQRECYSHAKTVAQNAYNLLFGKGYINIKQEDIQRLIHTAQELSINIDKSVTNNVISIENSLVSSPENIGKFRYKLLLIAGNAICDKVIRVKYINDKAVMLLEKETKREAAAQAKAEKEAEIERLKAEFDKAVTLQDSEKAMQIAIKLKQV